MTLKSPFAAVVLLAALSLGITNCGEFKATVTGSGTPQNNPTPAGADLSNPAAVRVAQAEVQFEQIGAAGARDYTLLIPNAAGGYDQFSYRENLSAFFGGQATAQGKQTHYTYQNSTDAQGQSIQKSPLPILSVHQKWDSVLVATYYKEDIAGVVMNDYSDELGETFVFRQTGNGGLALVADDNKIQELATDSGLSKYDALNRIRRHYLIDMTNLSNTSDLNAEWESMRNTIIQETTATL